MKFPKLQPVTSSRQRVDAFGGYNHNLRIGDGEFFDMQNMTSDYYPVLSPRGARGRHKPGFDLAAPQSIIANHGLCYIDGAAFVLPNGTQVDMGLSEGIKTLVSMGAYVIILPDKKWINVASYLDDTMEDESGDIEATYTLPSVRVKLCKQNGEVITQLSTSTQKPSDPADGQMWMDMSAYPPVLKKWCSAAGMWTEEKSYIRVYTAGRIFQKGDALVASEFSYSDPTITVYIPENPVVIESGDEYLVFEGVMTNSLDESTYSIPQEYTLSRTMPQMDYIIESGNRLWGCKYGSTENGFINEIYCSKLGDFKNWNSFQGISTDSYVASIGADGPFTGAINYGGRPFFFKEGCMIEVYGSYPASYQVQTTPCDGVQSGCEKSLAVVNNVLYYKSRGGVCAFDGSLPVRMGQELGAVQYGSAVAGGCGGKYYISMCSADTEQWHLFVYDAVKGLWHREDDLQAEIFCTYQNELYCIASGSDQIITILGSGEKSTEPVAWMVQSGEIGLSLPDTKYVTRLTVRMSLEENSEVSFSVQYDFEEEWIHLCTVPGASLRSFDIPIRPKRCDHMKLRIEGVGGAKIYSITKTIEQGSDIP